MAWLTEEDFLSLLARLVPDWYLAPLKDPGPGYEAYQSYAKMMERVSLAISRLETDAYIMTALGGARATCTVEFYRETAVNGAFTVNKGTIVRTSKTNRSFRTLEDVDFGALDLDVQVDVESVGFGYEYNVEGPATTADGTALAGEIDTVAIPLLTPLFAEPTIQVRQVDTASGGRPATLDQHGLDRLLPRKPGEDDATYAARIRALPDTISPDAIRRQLDAIFLPAQLHYDLIETWENRYQSCWNAPDGGPQDSVFGPTTLFAYNDPRDDRFIPRWMGDQDHRAAFVVILPEFPAFNDRGMAYNDPATAGEMSRAVSAWNSPVLDGPALSGVWNGEDDDSGEGRSAFLQVLWDTLESIKGGGVRIALIPAEADQVLPY